MWPPTATTRLSWTQLQDFKYYAHRVHCLSLFPPYSIILLRIMLLPTKIHVVKTPNSLFVDQSDFMVFEVWASKGWKWWLVERRGGHKWRQVGDKCEIKRTRALWASRVYWKASGGQVETSGRQMWNHAGREWSVVGDSWETRGDKWRQVGDKCEIMRSRAECTGRQVRNYADQSRASRVYWETSKPVWGEKNIESKRLGQRNMSSYICPSFARTAFRTKAIHLSCPS